MLYVFGYDFNILCILHFKLESIPAVAIRPRSSKGASKNCVDYPVVLWGFPESGFGFHGKILAELEPYFCFPLACKAEDFLPLETIAVRRASGNFFSIVLIWIANQITEGHQAGNGVLLLEYTLGRHRGLPNT